jgi:CDP-diacylglycerol--glycerol-3-phosphate 3-phosphatidyltransferase
MILNVPNQITVGRLVLTAVFFAIIAGYDVRDHRDATLNLCFWIFLVAVLSDILDGYLARRNNQVTAFGRVADPFADKILVCGAFTFFAGPGFVDDNGDSLSNVTSWMVVLILAREFLVTGLRGVTESKGKAFGANVYGKIKMFVQSFTACVILFAGSHQTTPFGELLISIRPALVWTTVAVTVLSGVSYVLAARTALAESNNA